MGGTQISGETHITATWAQIAPMVAGPYLPQDKKDVWVAVSKVLHIIHVYWAVSRGDGVQGVQLNPPPS